MNTDHGNAAQPKGSSHRHFRLLALVCVVVAISAALLWSLVRDRGKPRTQWIEPGLGQARVPSESVVASPDAREPDQVEPTEQRATAAIDPQDTHKVHEPSGFLYLIAVGTLAPAANSRWELVGTKGSTNAVADATGRIQVPIGTWSLNSLDQQWIAPATQVVVDAEREQVLWIDRAVSRTLRVRDLGGAPIQGATATWLARQVERTADAHKTMDPVTRTTDASGTVVFDSGPFENGTVAVMHPGYSRVRMSVCGVPSAVIEIYLEPAGPRRPVRFSSSKPERPLGPVVLRSADGLEVARSGTDPGVVEVPDWIQPSETLRVYASSAFPCQFRLADLITDSLVLPAVVPTRVRAVDPTACGSSIPVTFRIADGNELGGLELLLGGAARTLRHDDEVEVELPDGCVVEARATNVCGSMSDVRLEVGSTETPVQLVLSAPDQLEIAVRNTDAEGLMGASARVVGLGTFQADGQGIVRVPLQRMTRTIHVSAPGYSPVTLSRVGQDGAADATGSQLVVQLSRSDRATVRVLSTAGRPLGGMRVRAWPPRVDALLVNQGDWRAGSVSAAVEGTTNGQGACTLIGIRPGSVRIEVDLPPVLGTDEWLRSAYPPARFEHRLEGGGELVVRVPAPAPLALEVVNAMTGMPVPGFTLLGQAATVPPVEVAGGYWEGWVSSAVTRFNVVVEGLGSTSFSLEQGTDRDVRILRVGLDRATTLRVTGLPEPLEGTRLSIQVLEESPEGLHLAGSLEATLDARGEAILDLGPWEGMRFSIAPVDRGSARMQFDPDSQATPVGGALEFKARSLGD